MLTQQQRQLHCFLIPTPSPLLEGANGGTQFSVNYYFFGQFSVLVLILVSY